jgi:hypothetical protein
MDDTIRLTLKTRVLVLFKMMLEKSTLLKQGPVSISVTSMRPTLSMKVSVPFKMTLSRVRLFKQSEVLVSVTSTTPTLVVLKPVSVGE